MDNGALFISAYMTEMLEREVALAHAHLSESVSPGRINLLTDSLGSEASLLLAIRRTSAPLVGISIHLAEKDPDSDPSCPRLRAHCLGGPFHPSLADDDRCA